MSNKESQVQVGERVAARLLILVGDIDIAHQQILIASN